MTLAAQEPSTSLTYWFPKIQAAGLPVPRTIIVPMSDDAHSDVWSMLNGSKPGEAIQAFADDLASQASALGYPVFLRTCQTAAKHSWKHTCHVTRPEDMLSHICRIVEFSECADMLGLPWHNWVLRELLPTLPWGFCPGYADMPVCKEFRFFVEDAEVLCHHPYWPEDALRQGQSTVTDYAGLCHMSDEAHLHDLASRVGQAVGGSWSVDILETSRGWFVTDMAEAYHSYHWPACERLQNVKE